MGIERSVHQNAHDVKQRDDLWRDQSRDRHFGLMSNQETHKVWSEFGVCESDMDEAMGNIGSQIF